MKYLVLLKPLGPYFFGTDKTFNESYIARSALFPQQTQLLGMVRRVLLDRFKLLALAGNGSGWAPKDAAAKEKAIALIGNVWETGVQSMMDLGRIQSISPVFIVSLENTGAVGEAHFILPKDTGLLGEENPNASCGTLGMGNTENPREAFLFKDFSAKNPPATGLSRSSFWPKYAEGTSPGSSDQLSFDEVFVPWRQVGIKRAPNRQVHEDVAGSLYKKTSYTMKDPFRFAFILELDGQLFDTPYQQQVYLGAERSFFQMEAVALPPDFEEKFWPQTPSGGPGPLNKAVVMGDLFIKTTFWREHRFVLNEGFLPFSQLVPVSPGSPRFQTKKAKQRNLLPRGAVIYTQETDISVPDDCHCYTSIGYNNVIFF